MSAVKERVRWALAGTVFEKPAKSLWALLNGYKPSRYDAQTEEIIRKFARRNWNCVDVGANNGDISDLMLAKCPDGQHVLFEPIPANAALLKHKYRRRSNIKVIEAALSDKVGKTTFNYNVAHPATSGIKQQRYFTENNEIELIEVRLARLDDEVSTAVHLVKIDVEGAELLVLRGATETLKKHRPVVIFEHGPHAASFYGYGAGEVFDYFADLKYGIFLLADYLDSKPALIREQIVAYHQSATEWYFIAAPVT